MYRSSNRKTLRDRRSCACVLSPELPEQTGWGVLALLVFGSPSWLAHNWFPLYCLSSLTVEYANDYFESSASRTGIRHPPAHPPWDMKLCCLQLHLSFRIAGALGLDLDPSLPSRSKNLKLGHRLYSRIMAMDGGEFGPPVLVKQHYCGDRHATVHVH